MTAAILLAALTGGWGDVTASYVVTFAVVIAYAAFVIVRGRKVNKQLPPEDRRWM
jgi:hypothetical protein